MGVDGVARLVLLGELSERSIADIAREIEQLRNENARLKENVGRLEQELATQTPAFLHAKMENAVLSAAVKSLMQEGGYIQPVTRRARVGINSLPPEVLLRIFKATKSPTYEHDPSIAHIWIPWLDEIRYRKGLVLVCRAWLWSARAVLYEDIVLRRMGQISALARTLLDEGDNVRRGDFSGLVHHLRLDSCVVWAPCTEVVRDDLLDILRRCAALRTLSFHPHPNFPDAHHPDDVRDGWEGYNPTWLVHDHTDAFGQALEGRLSACLRELDIASTLTETQAVELHKLLASAQSLHSLKIGPVAKALSSEPFQGTISKLQDALRGLQPLSLPALSELQLHVDNAALIRLVSSCWSMPALKSVTALSCSVLPAELLKRHGRSLTYLNVCPEKRPGPVYDSSWEPCATAHLDELPEMCPMLDHLVFPAHKPTCTSGAIIGALRSPSLRHLDIWCHTCMAGRDRIEDERRRAVQSGSLPALVRIRRLRRIVCPDIPRVCHPSLVSGDEVRIHRFPRAYFLQTSWAVMPDNTQHADDPSFGHAFWEEDDDSGSYVTEESEDGKGEDDWEEEEEEEEEEEGEEEASSPTSDGTPYDPFDESGSESGRSSSDENEDDDIDAEISEWELDVAALQEELVGVNYDRATVLDMFHSTLQSSSDPSDDGEDMSVDGDPDDDD